MGERCEFSCQVQLTAFEGRLQAGELATKHAPQYSDGKEEAWVDRIQVASASMHLSEAGAP
jgi:hypothetical protein